MSGFGRQVFLSSAIAAVLVIGIGLGIYYALPSLGKSGATSSSFTTTAGNYSSEQLRENESIVATYFNTFTGITTASTFTRASTTLSTTNTTSSSFTTTSSTASSSDTSGGGAFTYSPSNSVVRILSVEADIGPYGSGNQSISFKVRFENVGSDSIYVVTGGGTSGLNATILWGSARTQTVSTPRCMIVEAPVAIAPRQNSTALTPGCWSGYDYVLLQPGTIEVQLKLSWSEGSSSQPSNNAVIITAEFDLA